MSVEDADWRDASQPPRVPGTNVHASCMTPLMFIIVRPSLITLALLVLAVIAVAILSSMGRDFGWITRRGISRLRRQVLSARPTYYWRRVLWVQPFEHLHLDDLRR